MGKIRFLALVIGLVPTWAAVAVADLPPDPGYVETCTVDQRQGERMTCVECSTDYSAPTACTDQYAPQGYTSVCHSRGASAWNEVWCQTAAEGTGTGEGTGSETLAPIQPETIQLTSVPTYVAAGGALALCILGFWTLRRRGTR